jgi:hypothetical protein
MKTAVIVYSDPKNGGEESLGRVFNALAATYDFKQQGDEVTLLFQGAGTRWVGELSQKDHPAMNSMNLCAIKLLVSRVDALLSLEPLPKSRSRVWN